MNGEGNKETFQALTMKIVKDIRMETDLKDKDATIEALRLRNQALRKTTKELNESLDANVEDRERVIKHKSNRIDELTEKVEMLETTLGTERETAAIKYMKLYKQFEQTKVELDKKLRFYEMELDQLKNFQDTKTNLEGIIKTLRRQIRDMEKAHLEDTRACEQKYIQECDRIRNDNARELARCKTEMRGMLENQLDNTTCRTIKENEQKRTELDYQSSQIEKLIYQNDALSKKNRDLMSQLDIESDMQQAVVRKVHFYETLFKKMQLQEKQQRRTTTSSQEPSGSSSSSTTETKTNDDSNSTPQQQPNIVIPETSQAIVKYLKETTSPVRAPIAVKKSTPSHRLRTLKPSRFKKPTSKDETKTYNDFITRSVLRLPHVTE